MVVIGALALAPSLPASALSATELAAATLGSPLSQSAETSTPPVDAQTLTASGFDGVAVVRDGYSSEAAPPPPPPTAVVEIATAGPVGVGGVRWPFPQETRISDGFGPRNAPCGGCSTFHDGLDMHPGDGAAIGSIADGVVVTSTDDGGGYGVYVEVESVVGGQTVTALYAHMQYGSRAVSVGDHIAAGQLIGLVGTTGQSTGPHLHLELFYSDGVRFDPDAWLTQHAG